MSTALGLSVLRRSLSSHHNPVINLNHHLVKVSQRSLSSSLGPASNLLKKNEFFSQQKRQQSSRENYGGGRRGFATVALFGVGVGTAWSLYNATSRDNQNQFEYHQKGNFSSDPKETLKDYTLESGLPPTFEPARSIVNPVDNTGLKITLFQYQTCPFCCKTRALLDYYGFSYEVIEVNSVMRTQMKWTSSKKVPTLVLQVPGKEGKKLKLQESSMIISALYSYIFDKSQDIEEVVSCFPRISYLDDAGAEKTDVMNKYFLMFKEAQTGRTKESIVSERKWRRWVDDELVHKLSPNVYRTPSEALETFKWFNEVGNWEKHFSAWERFVVIYIGAAAMYLIGKRLKKRHNLKDDVRQSLYDDCGIWTRAIQAKKTKFMGGDKPDLSDLAVYGVLSAIEGCQAFEDMKENTRIMTWYGAMKSAVENHEGQTLLQGR